jgi:transcriptional regulator with XRE-family HTH domain
MDKKMLGGTIYRLRKEKGLSQDELGKLVGVSNKAVSKWETDDANPEITLLPLLAKVLGVTADELLTDIKTEEDPVKSKAFGVGGTVIQTTEEYEFISDKKTMSGLPYLYIHRGRKIHTTKEKAKGVIAIGNYAKGIISIGFFSIGIFSLGVFSIGVFSLGIFTAGVVAIGLTTFGIAAIGGTAFGAVAVGLISFGAVAIGLLSYGAILISFHANIIELGIRKHIFI